MVPSLSQVLEFHQRFGLEIAPRPTTHPNNHDLWKLRVELIREELRELSDALDADDLVETFDALCDLQYVVDGAFLTFGFHGMKEHGMYEVHASNMSKLGRNGKPILREDGKILKGPDFFKPNLAGIIEDFA